MKQSWWVLAPLVIWAAVGVTSAQAQWLTPGDLIVSAYGSSNFSTSTGAPTPISLIEYSLTGVPTSLLASQVLTDSLATSNGVGGAGNLGVVGQYGSNSEGNIQLSGNGEYVALGGYSASAANAGIQSVTDSLNGQTFASGTPYSSSTIALAQSADTDVPRIAVLVDGNGNVNSSTSLNSVYNTNNIRSVYSANGSSVYLSGQGDGNNSDQGVFLATTATTNSRTGIYNSQDTRFVTGFNSNLYYSIDTGSGTHTGVWESTGLPTGSSTPTRVTSANNGQSGASEVFYSPDGFYFANATTLYVADTGAPKAGTLGDGGIQKWVFNGSTWTLKYTLTPSFPDWIAPGNPDHLTTGETGFEAITGEIVGSQVELFAISYTEADDNPDGLYEISDTLSSNSGAGNAFDELATSPGNGGLNFKGVSFAPVPEPTCLTILCVNGAALLRRRRRGWKRKSMSEIFKP